MFTLMACVFESNETRQVICNYTFIVYDSDNTYQDPYGGCIIMYYLYPYSVIESVVLVSGRICGDLLL